MRACFRCGRGLSARPSPSPAQTGWPPATSGPQTGHSSPRRLLRLHGHGACVARSSSQATEQVKRHCGTRDLTHTPPQPHGKRGARVCGGGERMNAVENVTGATQEEEEHAPACTHSCHTAVRNKTHHTAAHKTHIQHKTRRHTNAHFTKTTPNRQKVRRKQSKMFETDATSRAPDSPKSFPNKSHFTEKLPE